MLSAEIPIQNRQRSMNRGSYFYSARKESESICFFLSVQMTFVNKRKWNSTLICTTTPSAQWNQISSEPRIANRSSRTSPSPFTVVAMAITNPLHRYEKKCDNSFYSRYNIKWRQTVNCLAFYRSYELHVNCTWKGHVKIYARCMFLVVSFSAKYLFYRWAYPTSS